jgi:hypothetical protein
MDKFTSEDWAVILSSLAIAGGFLENENLRGQIEAVTKKVIDTIATETINTAIDKVIADIKA